MCLGRSLVYGLVKVLAQRMRRKRNRQIFDLPLAVRIAKFGVLKPYLLGQLVEREQCPAHGDPGAASKCSGYLMPPRQLRTHLLQ